MTLLFCILAILTLLLCSGLISASEVAFFSMTPGDKEELKSIENKSSTTAQKLLEAPQKLLATILIANNFVNVGIVILSNFLLSELLPNNSVSPLLRFILDVFIITTTILLIGEVIPKVYATKNKLVLVKFMSIPLKTIGNTPPFSWIQLFLINGTNLIHRYAKKRGVKVSTDELEQILALTREQSTSEDEHKILEGIISFGNTDVKQVMRPRMEVTAFDKEDSYNEILERIKEAGYSRIPIFENTFDNVIGILYIKDLLPYLKEENNFDWNKLIRKPFFVPENKKLDDLLKDFQSKKMHMAIVVDEYGGASGLITLEDILEEIVGDITDEFDEEELIFSKINENTYTFEGRTSLVDFYKILEIDGKEFENHKGEADTLGGFIVEQAGKILKNKEYIEFENYKLIIESSDKKRIKMIKVILPEKNNESNENENDL